MWIRVLSGTFILTAGCASQTPSERRPQVRIEPSTAQVAAGRQMAELKCSACHAIGTSGESTVSAAPPFRGLLRRYPDGRLRDVLSQSIVTGHPSMPGWVFTADELGALGAYIETVGAN